MKKRLLKKRQGALFFRNIQPQNDNFLKLAKERFQHPTEYTFYRVPAKYRVPANETDKRNADGLLQQEVANAVNEGTILPLITREH